MIACRSCGAPIQWATSTQGRVVPVDLQPSPDGNLVLVAEGRVTRALNTAVSEGPRHAEVQAALAAGSPRFKSHFATCPQAAEHRRKR